jgi:polyisoprenoid-binding protein YceI
MTMTNRQLFSSAALAAVSVFTTAAAPVPTTWNVDAAHTAVSFSVRHFFTPVTGQFEAMEANLTYDRQNPENSTVRVRIPVASLSTANAKRDNHLKSADFFEAEAYPYITFASESVKQVSEDQLLVRGQLKIKGWTRTVELPVKVLGVMDVAPEMRDMLGAQQIASFQTCGHPRPTPWPSNGPPSARWPYPSQRRACVPSGSAVRDNR